MISFKKFISESVVSESKMPNFCKALEEEGLTMKEDLDKEDIRDGEAYIDCKILKSYFDKAFKKYNITPANDNDFIELIVNFVLDEVDEKDAKEWKKYKESDFMHAFEYSEIYDEYANPDNWDENKILSLMKDMIDSGEYKKPSKKVLQSMIKDIKDYDIEYSDKEKVKMAAEENGLKKTKGKEITKIIPVVASDKYSISTAVKRAKAMARDFGGLKVTKAPENEGIEITGPEETVKTFLKYKLNKI